MEIKCINDYKTILKCAKIHSKRACLTLSKDRVKVIDDKYFDKKCLLRGIKSIILAVDCTLNVLIETTKKDLDLVNIGEIESMLNIVDWTLCRHTGILQLLTDEGKEFDAEFVELKRIISKYVELEKALNTDLDDE